MLGILCGIEAEAAIAHRIRGARVACAGARPQKARWLARELVKQGVTRLLSFGIAGALEPDLPIGTMVIGAQTASHGGTFACDESWIGELMQKLPQAHVGGVWGSEHLVPTAKDKRALYGKSRCLIVDMESQCAAQVANEAGIPFGVLRAVCDTSEMEVPPVVMAAIREDGRIDKLRALGHLLRRPWQIPSLVGMAAGTGKALKVLKEAASALS